MRVEASLRLLATLSVVGLSSVGNSACCEDQNRSWQVAGAVVDATTAAPIAGAEIEIVMFFSFEGVGNQRLTGITTRADGTFAATAEFVASCQPVLFGFFGSEVTTTSREPFHVDLHAAFDGIEQQTGFATTRDTGLVTEFETFPDGSVRGRIELPPIELEVPP